VSARKPQRSQPSPRRKAGRPAARKTKRKTAFRLVVEAQEMHVSYEPNWSTGEFACGHFEFRSPCDPPRRIIVSETGYLSHFAPMAEIEASASPEDYALEIVRAVIAHDKKGKRSDSETDMVSLFL
jgi:hypothetical protein